MAAKAPKVWFTTGVDIVARRKKLGLTQHAFWSRLGITQSGGSRYETSRNIPAPVKLLLQMTYGTEKQAEAMLCRLRRTPDTSELLQR